MANVDEEIGYVRLRWLGHVDGKKEEDVVMRTWKMEVSGRRKIGRPKLRQELQREETQDRKNLGNYKFMCRLQIEERQKSL